MSSQRDMSFDYYAEPPLFQNESKHGKSNEQSMDHEKLIFNYQNCRKKLFLLEKENEMLKLSLLENSQKRKESAKTDQLHQSHIEDLQQEIEFLKKSNQSYRRDIESLEHLVSEQTREIEILETQILNRDGNTDHLSSRLFEQKNNEKQQDLNSIKQLVQEKLGILEAKLKQRDNVITETKSQLATSQDTVSVCKQKQQKLLKITHKLAKIANFLTSKLEQSQDSKSNPSIMKICVELEKQLSIVRSYGINFDSGSKHVFAADSEIYAIPIQKSTPNIGDQSNLQEKMQAKKEVTDKKIQTQAQEMNHRKQSLKTENELQHLRELINFVSLSINNQESINSICAKIDAFEQIQHSKLKNNFESTTELAALFKKVLNTKKTNVLALFQARETISMLKSKIKTLKQHVERNVLSKFENELQLLTRYTQKLAFKLNDSQLKNTMFNEDHSLKLNQYKRQIEDLNNQKQELTSKYQKLKTSNEQMTAKYDKLQEKIAFYENKIHGIENTASMMENDWSLMNQKFLIVSKYLTAIINTQQNMNTSQDSHEFGEQPMKIIFRSQDINDMDIKDLDKFLHQFCVRLQDQQRIEHDTLELIALNQSLKSKNETLANENRTIAEKLAASKQDVNKVVIELTAAHEEVEKWVKQESNLKHQYTELKKKYDVLKQNSITSKVSEFSLLQNMSKMAQQITINGTEVLSEQLHELDPPVDAIKALNCCYHQSKDTDESQWIVAALKLGDYLNDIFSKHGIPAPGPTDINFALSKPQDKISVILNLYILYKMYIDQVNMNAKSSTEYFRVCNELKNKDDQLANLKFEMNKVEPNVQKINLYWQKQIAFTDKQIEKLKTQNNHLKRVNIDFKSELMQMKREAQLKTKEIKNLTNRTQKWVALSKIKSETQLL